MVSRSLGSRIFGKKPRYGAGLRCLLIENLISVARCLSN